MKNFISKKRSLSTTLALAISVLLAIATSVFATSLGTNLSVTGNIIVSSTSATSTFAAPIAASSGNQIISSAGTTNNLLLNPYGGNVGIGTTSPAAKLHIYNGVLLVNAPATPVLKSSTSVSSIIASYVQDI